MTKQERNKQRLEERFGFQVENQSNKYYRLVGRKKDNLNYYLIPSTATRTVETKYGTKIVANFENSDQTFWFGNYNVLKLHNGDYIINDFNDKHKAELARLSKGWDEVLPLDEVMKTNMEQERKINNIYKRDHELTEEEEALIGKEERKIYPIYINKKVIHPGILREHW